MNNLIKNTDMKRPHVVILGAGASRVALPNGDNNGKKLPVYVEWCQFNFQK